MVWRGNQLLGAMLAAQDETQRTLDRLEGKIDRLQLQPYESGMLSGYRYLADAQAEWRKSKERLSLVTQARIFFVEASSAAISQDSRALAETMVALCWLMVSSLPDCRLALDRASISALDGMVEALEEYSRPDPNEVERRMESSMSPLDRLTSRVSTTSRYGHHSRAVAFFQKSAKEDMRHYEALHRDIQTLRIAVGVPQADCPRVSAIPGMFRSAIAVRIDLSEPAQLFGITVTLNTYRTRAITGSYAIVDADLKVSIDQGPFGDAIIGFFAWGQSEQESLGRQVPLDSSDMVRLAQRAVARKGGETLRELYAAPDRKKKIYDADAAHQIQPQISGNPLRYREFFNVQVGKSARGWVKSVCEKKPHLLEIAVAPKAAPRSIGGRLLTKRKPHDPDVNLSFAHKVTS